MLLRHIHDAGAGLVRGEPGADVHGLMSSDEFRFRQFLFIHPHLPVKDLTRMPVPRRRSSESACARRATLKNSPSWTRRREAAAPGETMMAISMRALLCAACFRRLRRPGAGAETTLNVGLASGRHRRARPAHELGHARQELQAADLQRTGQAEAGEISPEFIEARPRRELDLLARRQGLDVQAAPRRAVPPRLRRVHLRRRGVLAEPRRDRETSTFSADYAHVRQGGGGGTSTPSASR